MKLSKRAKTSVLLFICFGADKIIAVLRQLIIARSFGMSAELDVFNIANNLPDMLFALISGGALSMALIPVMTDVNRREGPQSGWRLFSSVANFCFAIASLAAVVIWIFADTIVSSEIGIAPGFTVEQQRLVTELMRMNLIATLIFSVSGMVMGGLQANDSFLLPALAPIFYNLGQIYGAVVMAPSAGVRIGSLTLPCMNMGIRGLVGGVILGAILHLLVQVPALVRHHFYWRPEIDFRSEDVRRVLKVFGPRILSVFFVQMIFIVRDNYASRLTEGAVTALSYGYMFQQLPETLIGTALGTAILPSLSLLISEGKRDEFRSVLDKACNIAIALSLGAAAVMAVGLSPLTAAFLSLDEAQNTLLIRTLQGFLVGLAGHCLLEVANRAFYAQENALIPLLGTILNLGLYIGAGALLYRPLGAPGISLTDSIAFTVQAVVMLLLPAVRGDHRSASGIRPWRTLIRSLLGAAGAVMICSSVLHFAKFNGNILVKSICGMGLSLGFYLLWILPEIRSLRNL